MVAAYLRSTVDNPATPKAEHDPGELFIGMLKSFDVTFDSEGKVRNQGRGQLWRVGSWRREGTLVSLRTQEFAGTLHEHEETFRVEGNGLIWEGLYGIRIPLRRQEVP